MDKTEIDACMQKGLLAMQPDRLKGFGNTVEKYSVERQIKGTVGKYTLERQFISTVWKYTDS